MSAFPIKKKKWDEQRLAGRLVSSDSFPGSRDEQQGLNSALVEVGISPFPLMASHPRYTRYEVWPVYLIKYSNGLLLTAGFFTSIML